MPYFYNILILASTHLTLSFLYAAFRRPIELFLAEELLSLKGKNHKTIERAFAGRLLRSNRRKALLRRLIRYVFPMTNVVLLFILQALVTVSWPVSLCLSIRTYADSGLEENPTMEICNDV